MLHCCPSVPFGAILAFLLSLAGALTGFTAQSSMPDDDSAVDSLPNVFGVFTHLLVLNTVCLIAIVIARHDYHSKAEWEGKQGCFHKCLGCMGNPISLCIFRVLEWGSFLFMLLVCYIALSLVILVIMTNLICKAGSSTVSSAQDLLNTLAHVPGMGKTSEQIQSTLDNLDLSRACDTVDGLFDAAVVYLFGSTMCLIGQAFMAAAVHGERMRVEEEIILTEDHHEATVGEARMLLGGH